MFWRYLRLLHRQKWRTLVATVLQLELYRFRSQLHWYKLHQITVKLQDYHFQHSWNKVKASLDIFGISLLQLNLYPTDGQCHLIASSKLHTIVLHNAKMFVKVKWLQICACVYMF